MSAEAPGLNVLPDVLSAGVAVGDTAGTGLGLGLVPGLGLVVNAEPLLRLLPGMGAPVAVLVRLTAEVGSTTVAAAG